MSSLITDQYQLMVAQVIFEVLQILDDLRPARNQK